MPGDPDDPRDTLLDPARTNLGVGDTHGERLPDLTGNVVHGYFVEEELGAGAMGSVYRATHVESNRSVALKALHPRHFNQPSLVARFQREAQLASRLRHPNIAGVVEMLADHDGAHIIVLELAPGEPLANILTMPLPPERIISLVGQILRGLEHAHEAGLVHRDLKPDNIIVDWEDGTEHLRIVDFGIAALRDPEDGVEKLTATGQMIGTPIYMSPEQAKCEAFDHRTDLFALGVIVYEMLSGRLPFSGSSLEVALSNLNKDPPRMAERSPGILVDPRLEAFCRKLMARKLDERFASAREALAALEMEPDRALSVVSLPTRS